MNVKLMKLVKIASVGLFLIALAINVKATLDDPFTMVNEQALAQQTTGTVDCWDAIKVQDLSQSFYCGTCDWVNDSTETFWAQKIVCTPGVSGPE